MRRSVLLGLALLLCVGIVFAQETAYQIVDSQPLDGEEIGLTDEIVVAFNQDLNCDSVMTSIAPDVAGDVTCDGPALRFSPMDSYQPGTVYTLTMDVDGQVFDLSWRTRGSLAVTEVFPAPGSTGIAGDAVVTVIFNRPVVPLVAVEDMESLPDPLTFSPAMDGDGEWINTSIYTFTPATNWAGGIAYTATVTPGLTAADGAALAEPFSWRFTAEPPRLVEVMPEDAAGDVRLDATIQATFSSPIDQASLEASFYLRPIDAADQTVSGTFNWSNDSTGFRFTPDDLLTLNVAYAAGFPADSVFDDSGQVALPATQWSFATVPNPAIVGTNPSDGEQSAQPYGGFTLFFASPMDVETLRDRITIDPEPWRDPEFYYRDWNDELQVSFPTEPSTQYTITVAAGAEDVYGNTIASPFTFSYRTGPYSPDVSLQVPGNVGFYNAYRDETQLFVTHRNVSRLNLSLYSVPLSDFAGQAVNRDTYWDPTDGFVPRPENQLRSWQIESVAPENAQRYELLSLAAGGSDGTVVNCPDALPTRLRVGDSAIVITDPDPVRARANPPDGEIVDLLYRDYVMPVVDGPICADGILWWEIELRDGSTAWVAEGVGDEYFIDLRVPSQQTPVQIPQEFASGDALEPGVYYLEVNAPETGESRPRQHFMVVATANLTVKMSVDSMFVWATDVESGQPIANAPISIVDAGFNILAEGLTGPDGLARIDIPRVSDLFVPRMAVLDDGVQFGLGLTTWSEGIDPWRFGQPDAFYPEQFQVYLYTDRPIYRPDQPVYFRGVVRSKDDMIYTLPDMQTVPVKIYDDRAEVIYEKNLSLTRFGTFSDTLNLDPDAPLGFYRIEVSLPSQHEYRREGGSVFFNVAEYRLPEFQVEAEAVADEVVQGETVQVAFDSTYFFGGNVSDATVEYNVIADPYYFEYDGPGGRFDFTDSSPDGGPGEFFGSSGGLIASGEGITDGDGRFVVEVPADLEDATQSQRFTIEAVVRDESDQSVAGRSSVIVHQGLVYIGARPRSYVSNAGQDTTLEFIAVDWEGDPVAGQEIDVEIVERRWSSVQEQDPSGRTVWTWEVEEIPVTTAQITSGDGGRVDYVFIPPNGGIFKVKISSVDEAGNTVRASTTLWVSSREYVSWRQQNSNRIDLITDGDTYQVGDTAEILITSPFQGATEALVTVERGDVLLSERFTMESNSYVYRLPITPDMAPNVFVSVFLVKGVDETNPVAAFRMGLIGLTVDNSRKAITIDVQTDAEQAGPGDTVTYTVTTTDYTGEPVAAEVGVGLTDLASLSIGDANSEPILDFFYGRQRLSVRTSTPLTINTDQITQTVLDTIKGGGGGFGEGGIFDIREEFVDTAYWQADLVTDADGNATFEVTLPDNLTTWRLDARAVTNDNNGEMLVGQDTFDLLSTKPLLVRPVTPRFFVVGDEVQLLAVVNNNTGSAQTVEIGIEATGVTFQDAAAQTVVIPAGGRERVVWPVTVDDVASVDLTFFARSDDYADASKPPLGQGEDRLLPVYRYEVPEIVGTGGLLREAGTVTESIVLPERYANAQGELTVQVDTSLAATALEALDYLRLYSGESIEATVSRFLPNVMTYRALTQTGMGDPALEVTLDNLVQVAIQRLYAQQKVDGGWGWFVQDESNPLVTAYAVIGLSEALESGFAVDPAVIDRAQNFLREQFITPRLNIEAWRLDRQVFILYALARSGEPDIPRMTTFFESRERLSIYAKALLAIGLDMGGDTGRIDTLVSDLLNDAIVSANGVHWEESDRDFWNWNTDTRTTAMALQALIQLQPESDLIPNVVRWLMVARDADAWETNQETAWAVMALTDWMTLSGELQPGYEYAVSFNGEQRFAAQAAPGTVTESERLVFDVADMFGDRANDLMIGRSAGDGNLYYTAYLRNFLPVPEIEPVNRGIIIERRYTLLDDPDNRSIDSARIGEVVQVRLTIIAPNDLHYVVIEDPIPAGADPVDPGLTTSQQIGTRPGLDSDDPLSRGWGWWWFSNIDFRDEKVVLNSTYLPAGTYEYVYTIRPGLEGTFNVIPPTGREFYFPDVYGRGKGSTFTVLPAE